MAAARPAECAFACGGRCKILRGYCSALATSANHNLHGARHLNHTYNLHSACAALLTWLVSFPRSSPWASGATEYGDIIESQPRILPSNPTCYSAHKVSLPPAEMSSALRSLPVHFPSCVCSIICEQLRRIREQPGGVTGMFVLLTHQLQAIIREGVVRSQQRAFKAVDAEAAERRPAAQQLLQAVVEMLTQPVLHAGHRGSDLECQTQRHCQAQDDSWCCLGQVCNRTLHMGSCCLGAVTWSVQTCNALGASDASVQGNRQLCCAVVAERCTTATWRVKEGGHRGVGAACRDVLGQALQAAVLTVCS